LERNQSYNCALLVYNVRYRVRDDVGSGTLPEAKERVVVGKEALGVVTLAVGQSRDLDQARGRPLGAPTGEESLPAAVGTADAPATAPTLVKGEEEAQLVERARRDPTAFGVLYEHYIDRVYAYIYHRVGNAEDTEDLTARTFYRALDKLDSYEDRGLPFSAWLFRIAHNLVANWHRDHSRRSFLSLDRLWSHSRSGDTPHEQLEREEEHNELWAAIERLPSERRNLLLYKFGSRLSNLEIGELLDKSESAIKSLYFRTLSTLRKDLETRGWPGGSKEGESPQ
jgi:RNA polymerase sigma-70 factor, ECF subfamily